MPSTRDLKVKFPQHPGQFGGYGRNIRHDPRSVAYRVGRTAAPTTKLWERHIPILDQGNLGSCTGNATVGALGTGPNWDALSDDQRKGLNEDLAVKIYSGGTKRDSDPDNYPPVDTGSDGLSVAQEAEAEGYISGYRHIMSLGEAYAAILDGPFIVGSIFTADMENPDKNGIVVPKGQVLGGHEWLMRGYDADADEWLADNSWSDHWGIDGSFKMTSKTFSYLLAQQGDATPFVPLSQPKPQPAPVPAPPEPEPAPVPDPLVSFPFGTLDTWAEHIEAHAHPAGYEKAAATQYNAWKTSIGR